MLDRIDSKPIDPKRRILLLGGITAILFGMGWTVINRYASEPFGIDPGIFAAVGFHLAEGKVPYKNAWDHKPPMVFFLNAIGFWAGGDFVGVRTVQRVFAGIILSAIFLILMEVFRDAAAAVSGALLASIHLYHPALYGGGNYAEEYGVGFTLLGIWTVVRFRKADSSSKSWAGAAAGFWFGLAAQTKEPFLFAAIPWWVYFIFAPNTTKREKARFTLFFALGGLVPILVWAAYFVREGALWEWLDSIHYSFRYVTSTKDEGWGEAISETLLMFSERVSSTTVTGTFLFLIGLASSLSRKFNQTYDQFPTVVFGSFLAHAFATMLSGWSMNHYLIQTALPFALAAGTGTAWLITAARTHRRTWAAYALSASTTIALDGGEWREFVRPCLVQPGPVEISPVSAAVRKHSRPEDLIWISSGHIARVYVESERLSAAARLAPFGHHFLDTFGSTESEKWDELLIELQETQPKFIATGPEGLKETGWNPVVDWLSTHYVEAPLTHPGDSIRLFIPMGARIDWGEKLPYEP